MAAKKKATSKKHPTHHGGAKKTAKRRSSTHPHRRNPSVPDGMVLVPMSSVGGMVENPAKKKRHSSKHPHRRPHHPRKHNPAPETEGVHPHLKQAGAAVAFGLAAAVAGVAGGWALSKAGMKSKAANVAANVAAGTLIGGGVGLADRTAGTVLAHNYFVAASQWALADVPNGAPTQSRAPQRLAGNRSAGAPAARQLPARSLSAADELGGYEKLEGVIADNFAGPDELGNADELGGYEKLEGVIADNFAGPDELGDAEHMEALDDLGDEFSGPDDFGDADPY